MKLTAFLIALAAFPVAAAAQYYPASAPVAPERLSELLLKLKNSPADTNRVNYLLDLANLYMNKPLGIRANYDAGMRFALQASQLSASLHFTRGYDEAQYARACIYVRMNDLPSANGLLAKAQDINRIDYLLLLSYAITNSSDTKKQQDSAYNLSRQALLLSEKFHQPGKKAMALEDMAFNDLFRNQFSDADSLLSEAKRVATGNSQHNRQHICFLYGLLNFRKAKYDTALIYGLEAIKLMQATKDTLPAGDYYLFLAYIYNHVGKQELSIQYSKMALACYVIHPGQFSLFQAIAEANSAMTRLGRKEEAQAFLKQNFRLYTPQNYDDSSNAIDALCGYYIAMKEYDQAERLLLQHLRSGIQRNIAGAEDYYAVGDAFIQGRKYAQAKPYLLKALSFDGYRFKVSQQANIQYYLFLCDSAAGDYISAIRHLDLNKLLDDSNNKVSRNNEIQRLTIQYETEKKETDLKLKDQRIQLLTQKNQVQQADLRHANLVKDVTILGVLLLLAGGGLLFRQYRQKQRANRLVSTQNDLISRKNQLLEHLVTEKDWLLKEVHHRVKNNLHTVICLLESQAYYLENDALKAIENTQHRIYAMSLIHQRIYQSDDVRTIDMANYLPDFVHYLRDSFGGLPHICFLLDVEPMTLGVGQAIPLALIVNEAVTNSIKYAFPGNRPGEITVQLHETGGQIRLFISDNGVGLDPEIKNTEPNSLGLQLMKGLSQEIYGTFSFEADKGVRIVVLFDKEPLVGSLMQANQAGQVEIHQVLTIK